MAYRFVKLLIPFCCVLVFAISSIAQTKCDLVNSPKLLNLNLGMASTDVKLVFGKDLNVKVKNKGEQTFFQNYIEKPAQNRLVGIRALYLRFFDDKLYQIEIFYENSSDSLTLLDFTKAISVEMNFAEDTWQIKHNKALISCGEFSLFADNILNPRIELTDETTLVKVKSLRKDKK